LTFRLQGAFDSFKHEHLPRTKYDVVVDESSNKPGEQAFEVYSSSYVVYSLPTGSVRN
jgi:hexokinase